MFSLLSCCVEFQNPMTLFNCYDTEIEVIPLISLIFLALIYGDSNNRQQLFISHTLNLLKSIEHTTSDHIYWKLVIQFESQWEKFTLSSWSISSPGQRPEGLSGQSGQRSSSVLSWPNVSCTENVFSVR